MLEDSIESHSITKTKLIHIGMDEPSTNWAVLDQLSQNISELELPRLERTGASGAHHSQRTIFNHYYESIKINVL